MMVHGSNKEKKGRTREAERERQRRRKGEYWRRSTLFVSPIIAFNRIQKGALLSEPAAIDCIEIACQIFVFSFLCHVP